MTTADELLKDIERAQPQPERDRYGRYMLPDPDSDSAKPVAWTRSTTWAQTLSDKFGLNRWEKRMVAKGLSTRPDLLALIASTSLEEKEALDRLVEKAKEAAAASSGANSGTALHQFTEAVDRGEDIHIPQPWDRDVDAYVERMRAERLEIIPSYIERIVVCPNLGVAGTFDRIVRQPDGRMAIFDLKTGKDLRYAWGEISIQLAIYARSSHMWDAFERTYNLMPDVRQDIAIVAHLPVGRAECVIYEVDIEAGWLDAVLAGRVRAARKRRSLSRLYDSRCPTERIAEADSIPMLKALWNQAKSNGLDTEEVKHAVRTRMGQLKS